jgi:phosphoglycerol transferase MdoB-like AlkP superfamily enzyme
MFPSLLSGTPALPERSLVRYNDKTAQLPMLPKALAELGYSTSFHYGGDLGFANMNSFLRKAGFQQLTGEPDFDNALHRGKWGVADGSVFNRLNRDLQHKTEPFFSMTLTLSSHEPFDVPPPYNTGRSEPERFCKAARYTDAELGSFLREASKQAWFNNTLFVFIADHGHILPKRRNYYDPNCHRIPMLWWGPALPDTLRGSRISQPGAQHDFPATLTEALGIQFTKSVFPFSGNIINRSSVPRPVYLNFETGFGWKSTNGQFVYLFSQNSYLKEYTTRTGTDSTLFEDGKAYLQTLEQYFNSL